MLRAASGVRGSSSMEPRAGGASPTKDEANTIAACAATAIRPAAWREGGSEPSVIALLSLRFAAEWLTADERNLRIRSRTHICRLQRGAVGVTMQQAGGSWSTVSAARQSAAWRDGKRKASCLPCAPAMAWILVLRRSRLTLSAWAYHHSRRQPNGESSRACCRSGPRPVSRQPRPALQIRPARRLLPTYVYVGCTVIVRTMSA